MAAEERSSPLVLALLAVLTVLALALRVAGIGFMLPYHEEPDAVIVWQAAYLELPPGEPPNDRAHPATYYPRLLARLLSVLPGHSYPHVLPASATLEEHLSSAAEPYRRARWLVAVLAVLAVPATFFVARRFLAPGWSLLASAFMATSLLNVTYSAQARPHCASTSLSLIAMLPVLALVRSGRFWSYVAAGVLTGITVGCLQNGVFVVPALVVAHVLSPKRNWRGFFAALAIVAVAVLGFYWFLFQSKLVNPAGEVDIGGQTLTWSLINGDGFRQIFYGFWAYEPLLCAIAAIGAAIGIARLVRSESRPSADTLRELATALAFPLSFAAAWGWMSVVQPRFVNPLIPYLAILGAYGASVLIPKLNASLSGAQYRAACVVSSLVLLAVPTYASTKLACLRAEPDTLARAARWIEEHVDREQDLLLFEIDLCLPLPVQSAGIEPVPSTFRFPWDRYLLKLGREATAGGYRVHKLYRPGLTNRELVSPEKIGAMLAEEHAQYAVAIVPTGPAVGLNLTRDALRAAAGEPVFAALPFDLALTELNGSAYEQHFHAFERVMSSDVWGPPVEIYRLK
jgi:hypothetical protein